MPPLLLLLLLVFAIAVSSLVVIPKRPHAKALQ
jgi:hypothetical protein